MYYYELLQTVHIWAYFAVTVHLPLATLGNGVICPHFRNNSYFVGTKKNCISSSLEDVLKTKACKQAAMKRGCKSSSELSSANIHHFCKHFVGGFLSEAFWYINNKITLRLCEQRETSYIACLYAFTIKTWNKSHMSHHFDRLFFTHG